MPRSIRSLLRRPERPDDGLAGSIAPDSLRKRVLAGVRGEPPPRRSSRALAGGALASVAVAMALFVLIPAAKHNGPGVRDRPGAGAHAFLRRGPDRSELEVSGLTEPPVGEIYEMWLERSGEPPHPTDVLFTVTHAGTATVEVPGGLRGVRQVMVTAEPLGGSSSPTSAPVLQVAVPSS